MNKWNFQLWLALNGAQYINTLFCKPINQNKPRWRQVKRILEENKGLRFIKAEGENSLLQ